MYDMSSSSIPGANSFFPHVLSIYEVRREEGRSPMMLEYFDRNVCVNPTWYLMEVLIVCILSKYGILLGLREVFESSVSDAFSERLHIYYTKHMGLYVSRTELDTSM